MSNKIVRKAKKIFDADLDKAEKIILERFKVLVKNPLKKFKTTYRPPLRGRF